MLASCNAVRCRKFVAMHPGASKAKKAWKCRTATSSIKTRDIGRSAAVPASNIGTHTAPELDNTAASPILSYVVFNKLLMYDDTSFN